MVETVEMRPETRHRQSSGIVGNMVDFESPLRLDSFAADRKHFVRKAAACSIVAAAAAAVDCMQMVSGRRNRNRM